MSAPVAWPGAADFLLNTPLYMKVLSEATWSAEPASLSPAILVSGVLRLDGHCVYCKQASTFTKIYTSSNYDVRPSWSEMSGKTFEVRVRCARQDSHLYRFFVSAGVDTFQKIGQYPSLADIANDESRAYSKVMSRKDQDEFHRAIGLAAHGIGIGSFVYLRRIFERLIDQRFEEHREAEKWNRDEFVKLRMEERIKLLATFLPEFLVTNRKTYGLLSLGMHELEEDVCLAMFRVLKMSIAFMLAEDEERRKRAEMKKAVEADLVKLQADLSGGAAEAKT